MLKQQPLYPMAKSTGEELPTHPGSRGEILNAARECVLKDRATTHGPVEDSFATIAKIWSARLGVVIRADQVAIMMIDLKGVRAWSNPQHLDNWVDMAGYGACGGELASAI